MEALRSHWRSPSNIALVKYWGKYPGQIPANPSLSFTLSSSHTTTQLGLAAKSDSAPPQVRVFLAGEERPDFVPKIQQFLERLGTEAAFLQGYDLRIDTENSFPHSSGIASSASGMSALALALLDLQEQVSGQPVEDFYRTASHWARLGSGSASRSVYGPAAVWGHHADFPGSADEYALPLPTEGLHAVFHDFRDYILLVETGAKAVSSSAGHDLMKEHPYARKRFSQAHTYLGHLQKILQEGALTEFGALVEREALTLHAMMMSSDPYFLLLKAGTVEIIHRLWNWRRERDLPVFFTLDAGANVHLLFPTTYEHDVKQWVDSEITAFLQDGKYLRDQVGPGPQKLEA